jgi:hypothetical protein
MARSISVDFDIDKNRYGWHIDGSRYDDTLRYEPMYDSITSWLMTGGPRDEHAIPGQRGAPHSSDGTRHRDARRLPRWFRSDRLRSMSATPAACCAAA